MELVLFYAVMIICGSGEALLYCNLKNKPENSSLAAKYPLSGVISFFCLMGAIYWLLTMAEKEIWHTYFGFISLVLSYLTTKQICKDIKKKQK